MRTKMGGSGKREEVAVVVREERWWTRWKRYRESETALTFV